MYVLFESQQSLKRLWHLEESELKVNITVFSVILQQGLCGAGVPPLWIAQDLQEQVKNPLSLLKQGTVTSKAVAVELIASFLPEAVPVYPLSPSLTPASYLDPNDPADTGSLASKYPLNPSRTRGQGPFYGVSQDLSYLDANDTASARGRLPLASEAQLHTRPTEQTLPHSPRAIATTAAPPIFLTSMTPEGKFQAYESSPQYAQISADLGYPTQARPVFTTGQGAFYGVSQNLPSLSPTGPGDDGETGKGLHAGSSEEPSSASGSGGNGEHLQFQTAVVEPGSYSSGSAELEEAIFHVSGKHLMGAHRARAAYAAVRDAEDPPEKSSWVALATPSEASERRSDYAWKFGL